MSVFLAYCYVPKLTFFSGILLLFSSGRGSPLSRSRQRGTQGARVCTTEQNASPGRGPVARALSLLQGSRILADNYRESFRPARAKQDNGHPMNLQMIVCCWLLAAGCIVSDHTVPRALYNEAGAVVVHQALPFVAAPRGRHVLCVCVCVCGPWFLST